MGPISDVDRSFCTLCAAADASAQIVAFGPPIVIFSGNCQITWPPMPPARVKCFGQLAPGPPHGRGRHRWGFSRWVCRITGKARNAHHAVIISKEWRERLIIRRPVIFDAIQCAHFEIRRMQAWEMCTVQNGATTDTVEVRHLDRRGVIIDWIILGQAALIWAERKVTRAPRLQIPPSRGKGLLIRHTTLLKA